MRNRGDRLVDGWVVNSFYPCIIHVRYSSKDRAFSNGKVGLKILSVIPMNKPMLIMWVQVDQVDRFTWANHVVINNGVSVAANGGASVPWIAQVEYACNRWRGRRLRWWWWRPFSSKEHPLSTMQVPPMQISPQRVDRARQQAEHRAMGMTAQSVWSAHGELLKLYQRTLN